VYVHIVNNQLFILIEYRYYFAKIHPRKGCQMAAKIPQMCPEKKVQMGRGDVWIWWIRRQRIHPTSDPQNWRVFGAGKPDLRHFFGKILCFSALAWRRCPNYRTDW